MTLGELLREGRNSKGLTLVEAAERINVSKLTYIRLEKDQTKIISFKSIIGIANNLEIDFFRMLKTQEKCLVNLDIKTAAKVARRFLYNKTIINSSKLEKLIEENINYLKDTNEF